MNIKRIHNYTDNRFSKTVLNQHGAYLIDNEPYQVEITDASSAVLYGENPAAFQTLIEEFRFHAPHIFKFYDPCARLIAEYPAPTLFDLPLESIQPSQFYVDEEKLRAVQTFIGSTEEYCCSGHSLWGQVYFFRWSYAPVFGCAEGFHHCKSGRKRNG